MLYLFDIDGTLLLSGGAGRRALERVFFARYGVAGAMAGISPNGMTDPAIVARMFETLGRQAEAAEIAALLCEYEPALEDEVARGTGFRIMPGAVAAVSMLAERGALMGLATGNTEAGARIKLLRADLWHHFRCGGYGSDSHHRAELVGTAIRRASECYETSFAPEEVLVIGDTPLDIDAARAVGARVAVVATGGHSMEALAAHEPDEVYPDLEAMLPRLQAEIR